MYWVVGCTLGLIYQVGTLQKVGCGPEFDSWACQETFAFNSTAWLVFTEDCMLNKHGIVLDLDPTNHQYSIYHCTFCMHLTSQKCLVS